MVLWPNYYSFLTFFQVQLEDLVMAMVTIIDDDQELLAVLSDILEGEGYEVNAYPSARHIEDLDPREVDVFLIDLWIQGKPDGYKLAKQLKQKQSKFCDIPVVMVSSDPDLQTYAQSAGADTYMAKPIDFSALMAEIQELSQKN
jgi:DNA-binding response OmpR family regulator